MVIKCFPSPIDRQALKGFVYDAIKVTDEIADMLITGRDFNRDFNPTSFNALGIPPSPDGGLMAEAFIPIAGRGVIDDPAA